MGINGSSFLVSGGGQADLQRRAWVKHRGRRPTYQPTFDASTNASYQGMLQMPQQQQMAYGMPNDGGKAGGDAAAAFAGIPNRAGFPYNGSPFGGGPMAKGSMNPTGAADFSQDNAPKT